MTESRANILIPTAAALVGALIGGGFTAWSANIAAASQQEIQKTQFAQEQSRLLREKRAPYYASYDLAVQKYGTAITSRYECETAKVAACATSREELQSARYDLQRGINDIHIYGSPEMRAAVSLVAQTMPNTQTGFTGYVKVEPIDSEAFDKAVRTARSVTCFDVSPDTSSCPPPSR